MSKTQFDRQVILNKATALFWRVGYHATSMQNVFEATGLKPGSIYLAFGNKEGLFKESIEYYSQTSIEKFNEKFSQQQAIEKTICEILLSFVDESTEAEYCSCFLIKSQLELDDRPDLKQYISTYLAKVEQLYTAQLATIYGQEEADQKAASIMVHIFGLRVYGYHINSKERMLSSLRLGLPWLPWPELGH